MEIKYVVYEYVNPNEPVQIEEGWTLLGTPDVEYELSDTEHETGRVHIHAILQREVTSLTKKKTMRLLDRG